MADSEWPQDEHASPAGTRSSGSARLTKAGDDKVDRCGLESVFRFEVHSGSLHDLTRMMLNVATTLTDHVKVIISVCRFPTRGAINAQVGTAYNVELGQQGERAIDRRRMHTRIDVTNSIGDLLSSEVPIRRAQHFPYQATRFRQSMTASTQQGADLHMPDDTPASLHQ